MADVVATNRWRGVVAVALVAGALGLVAQRPSLPLVAVLGVVFAAYARVTTAPRVDLELDRRLDPTDPAPGDVVTVEVTVRNTGPDRLWDLRLVDGVPPTLAVVGGTPRHAAVLPFGSTTTFSYQVEAAYGRHRFEPATVVARDASGANERRTTVAADTELSCLPTAASIPPRVTNRDVGPLASRRGSAGVEFTHVREYRRGDAARHIDWNRYARSRTLTTVQYREQRAQTVVLAVDSRRPAYRGLAGGPDARSASVAAADQLATALVDGRNRVGVTALGWPDVWLAPATGREHLLLVRSHLATHPAFGATPPDEDAPDEDAPPEDGLDRLRARLPPGAQIWLLSPLCDDEAVDLVRRFEADDHPVTVVSPDVTADDTTGRRLARLERAARVDALRRSAVPVLEWSPTEPLASAIAAREAHQWP